MAPKNHLVGLNGCRDKAAPTNTKGQQDPLLARLKKLLNNGAIPASSLTERHRIRLAPLFDSGVLEERRVGAGRRIVVMANGPLMDFTQRLYPYAFTNLGNKSQNTDPELPQLDAILCHGGNRAAGATITQPILLRGFGTAELQGRTVPSMIRPKSSAQPILSVAQLTRLVGLTALRLQAPFQWGFKGHMAVVENLEVFLGFERLGLDVELVVYSGGRLSKLVLAWLASEPMSSAEILYLGDYDPSGLLEYLRLKEAVGERTSIYVPDNLEALVKKFGKRAMMEGQEITLSRLRTCGYSEIEWITGLLEEWESGLEQEILLYQDTNTNGGVDSSRDIVANNS